MAAAEPPEWAKDYNHALHVPEAHRAPLPPEEWFATHLRQVLFEVDGASDPLTPEEIEGTLRPFKLLSRDGDPWERRIYERVENKLNAWHTNCAKFTPPGREEGMFADYAKWAIDSVRLIFNGDAMTAFDAIPSEPDAREPFLAFHGTQLCNFRRIIKSGFYCEGADGWYGNGGYFTTSLPYAQHYIGGTPRIPSLASTEHGMLLPQKGHVVYMFGVMLKPGMVLQIEEDKTPPYMPYDGPFRNKGKSADHDSHIAFVSPANPQAFKSGKGHRPVARREDAFAEEVVIFNPERILPRYIIGLRRVE